jgi:hypothetical protein
VHFLNTYISETVIAMAGSTFSFYSSIVVVAAAALTTFSLLTSVPIIFAEVSNSGDTNSSMLNSQKSNNDSNFNEKYVDE